ncbi:hypothetical protein COHA_005068 [Chlorella ohadii]|uniref:Uncharacterized protein n=1 Tax=Chlorella ohadii TaxID=2649997 RepID=A0AAD5DS13_9CHLO|nr:hypothetical protein COHA_005068 [Chlorella ohadii]
MCRRLRVYAAAAGHPAQPDSGSGGDCSGSSSITAGKKASRRGSEKEAQPQLQAWLQQEQGLAAADADQHARRLALVFGSQQTALDGLPATFEWCHSRGLKALQTAQLLDRIANKRQENVVQFAALVQPVWQLMDSHIAAYVEPLRQAGARLPKHTSLAEMLCGNKQAAEALGMPPGHVEAWLAAVGQQLPAAVIGRLLLGAPAVVAGSPATALAAIGWAVNVLGAADPAALLAQAPTLLATEAATLQRNLDSLQHMLKQLADVVSRGPRLLTTTEQHLRANADYMQQALGWQDGDGQLAAFVAAYPQPFATVNLSGEGAADKLRLLTQERAPRLLFNKSGELNLSWVVNVVKPNHLAAMGLTRAEYNTLAGSLEGWPRPISAAEAAQRQQVQAEQQLQAKAGRHTGKAAAMDDKRKGRRRRGSQPAAGGGGVDGEAVV